MYKLLNTEKLTHAQLELQIVIDINTSNFIIMHGYVRENFYIYTATTLLFTNSNPILDQMIMENVLALNILSWKKFLPNVIMQYVTTIIEYKLLKFQLFSKIKK